MRMWLRPGVLGVIVLLLGLAGAGAFFYLRGVDEEHPRALPLADDEREIVWLDLATNSPAWEQFVAALQQTAQSLQSEFPGLSVREARGAEPEQARAVPEVVLSRPDGPRLVFRWYKITSDFRTSAWVTALLARPTPPLAIIGGSSTNRARELAWQLQSQGASLPPERRPILLLTTATADRVPLPRDAPEEEPVGPTNDEHLEPQDTPQRWLSTLYPGRTFRFGFTNLQMADAVVQFVWSQPDLRPEAEPAHLIRWDDDTYSQDLVNGFRKALRLHASTLGRGRLPPLVHPIASGVGGFDHPNVFESFAVENLCAVLRGDPEPRGRVLLTVTGQSQPSRRFLRGLARLSPASARRAVVVTADALSFNTVYRDRQVFWSVQDLPYPLVFFCHYNPVDPAAGFRPQPDGRPVFSADHPRETAATATDDFLLYAHLVTQVVRAAWKDDPIREPAELGVRLADARLDGKPLFDTNGERRSGAGEFVVCLRPLAENGEAPTAARLSVWVRRLDDNGSPAWARQCPDLLVSYDDLALKGDPAP